MAANDPITPKQASYISDLLDKQDLSNAQKYSAGEIEQLKTETKALLPRFNQRQASELIERLKAFPRLPKAQSGPTQPELWPEVPEGRYALDMQGEARFYKVDRPTEGKYEGFTFLAELSGDNHVPIKQPAQKRQILQDIAQDIEAAARRYGHYRRECGFCKKRLTDPFSRFFDVGPTCRKDHDMPISRAAFLRERPEMAETLLHWEHEDTAVTR